MKTYEKEASAIALTLGWRSIASARQLILKRERAFHDSPAKQVSFLIQYTVRLFFSSVLQICALATSAKLGSLLVQVQNLSCAALRRHCLDIRTLKAA